MRNLENLNFVSKKIFTCFKWKKTFNKRIQKKYQNLRRRIIRLNLLLLSNGWKYMEIRRYKYYDRTGYKLAPVT